MARQLLWLVLFFASTLPALAAPLPPADVPEPLKPWIPWVLHGEEQTACPTPYNAPNLWECSWPTELSLNMGHAGGAFRQTWRMVTDGWIRLPGNVKHWPQEVKINGNETAVVERNGAPTIHVAKGTYSIEGRYQWQQLPEFLQIDPRTALVSLQLNDESVAIPDVDSDGRLWLRKTDGDGSSAADGGEDRLDMKVFRRIVDEIPLGQIVRIELDVAGKPREILLGQGLPAGYLPVSLNTPLPARLEPDGRLRLQVRPGRWVMELVCRHTGPVKEIPLAEAGTPWPLAEIWVFDARNHLRLVSIEGGTPIDPQQTTMPPEWRNLPAYRLMPGEALRLVEKRRGDPDPAPDQLMLYRKIWLDFSGEGYTVQDRISGTMTRGWRLEMLSPASLGQVTVDGIPQFITRLEESGKEGVEVRRGQIRLVADSRTTGGGRTMPAVGWDHDFQQVEALLHLPPGWRLFNAAGVDDVPGTWLKRWTLLDLFVVLIIALSVFKLWGPGWGVVALAALALCYHEPFAPRFVWLHVLFAVALLRVLPGNRFSRLVTLYRNGAMIALLLIALPFMVDQVRKGIFPQLERPWEMVGSPAAVQQERMPASPQVLEEDFEIRGGVDREAPLRSEMSVTKDKVRDRYYDSLRDLQYDPKATVQTGPGLPSWQWTTVPLRWSGPVERNQTLRFTLIPPGVNIILAFIRVFLLGALILCVFGISYGRGGGLKSSLFKAAGKTGLTLLLLGLTLASAPRPAAAGFPSQQMLDQLKNRLMAPADCFPQCADSPRMRLDVEADRLVARLEVHTLNHTAVPLPGSRDQWLPSRVLLNGASAKGLMKSPEGQLWIELPAGRHQILVEGPLPPRPSVQLALPLKPHRVDASVRGWTLDGLHDNGVAESNLQLNRIQEVEVTEKLPALEPGTLPAFVRIERDLILGLDWELNTRVVRISPAGSAVVLQVPLLPGESVTSEHVRVEGEEVLINMGPDEKAVAWASVLEKTEMMTLRAPETSDWIEVWRVDVSPIWHVEFGGIPVVHHQSRNRWLPEWHPWPGEEVTLALSRPEGVPGNTLTIDNTAVTVTPGRRATDTGLQMTLRSSQGGQHTISLPEGARLQSVQINGVEQPIRQEGDQLTLPLVPGSQRIAIQVQQSRPMATLFRTPKFDLKMESVNANVEFHVPRNRWILLTGGPELGPAVLFWGVVLVVILVALVLGRVPSTPLRTHHWFLLGIGLSAAFVFTAIFVVAWLFAMGQRKGFGEKVNHRLFNLVQVGLGILTVTAAGALLFAIQQGLLGYPDMQIGGNGSSSFLLRWYLDRPGPTLPQAWVLTVPLFVYRCLMLAWALWIAAAMLRWSRWAWDCFSTNGVWRSGKILGGDEPVHNPSHTVVPPDER